MDIFKLREMTGRTMSNEEKTQLQNFVGSIIENVRETLRDRKGLETKILSLTETPSTLCATDLGVRLEFTIERKGISRVVVLNVIPSHQKITFSSHDLKGEAKEARADFKLTMEGSRMSALKVFDLIDFEDCFKKAA